MKNLRKIVLASSLVLFMFALVFVSAPGKALAAADIAIASSKITSANTVLVTFVNPGQNLASVDFTKWHIDQNDGGSSPLTPASAVVTSAGTPWTVTLTFAGTPFSATDKTYDAAHGLYADAAAVTDTNADTNIVVAHGSSTAITDGQLPTFTASRTAVNTVVLTFSEAVDASDTATAAWTVSGGATVASVTDPANTTALTITTTGQTSTSGTVTVNYVAGSGTVVDAATNEVANGGAVVASDHVPPTLAITMSDYDLSGGDTSTVTFTFSEAPTGFDASDVTVGHGTLGTIDPTVPTAQTAVFTADDVSTTDAISVGTGWTDSSAALNAPAGVSSSASYTISSNGGGGHHGSGGGSSNNNNDNSATPADPTSVPADCTAGVMFSPSTGRNCNAAAPAIPAGCTASTSFSPLTGQKCPMNSVIVVSPSPAGNFGYAWGTATVRLGSKGEACKAWQMFFNGKAVTGMGLVVDGICGPKTMAAAKSWQASMGLVADGILGPKSRAKALMQ